MNTGTRFESGDPGLSAQQFREGRLNKAYRFFGNHELPDGRRVFRVWAPEAKYLNLVGDFNDWHEFNLPMSPIGDTGVWEMVVEGTREYDAYKYRIVTKDDRVTYKADPFAFHAEVRPRTASKICGIDGHEWGDSAWMKRRAQRRGKGEPISVYEVNLSSWRHKGPNRPLDYEDLIDTLVPYVSDMRFTHVELMPITEYPYEGSWGYQVTGYFAPTSRFGTPLQLKALIDAFHQAGVGVLLDWVPAHFCRDGHGLARFDGSCLYEKSEPALSEHPAWGTLRFDYSKPQVRNFLIDSALYWLEEYHIDGLRVDAVSDMLYLKGVEASDTPGAGSRVNQEGIDFIRELNTAVRRKVPDALMIAEESTGWPHVTGRPNDGGLGFHYKWNLGWMHDTLGYFMLDPIFRKDHHDELTFSLMYSFAESYVLPFSHDEVVHGKRSMLQKMSGSAEQKLLQLKLLYAYQFAFPGKKLLFMGDEFAVYGEWNEWGQLPWELLDIPTHWQIKDLVTDLNLVYRDNPALWEMDGDSRGFAWLDRDHREESMLAFERKGRFGSVVCAFSFTPVWRKQFEIPVPEPGIYKRIFSTQTDGYEDFRAEYPSYARDGKQYISVDFPPFGGAYFRLKS